MGTAHEQSCEVLFVNTETTLRISRELAAGSRQMVAAKHPWAVRAGNDILDQGGNAVDAAVATAFAISVVEPWMSGLGGVGFMTIQRATGERYVVDYFGQAPAAATPDMYELTEEFGPIRFISAEPLLGPVDELSLEGLHWVITGGESGAGHRRCDPAWVRDVRDRSVAAGVAYFHKQWGGRTPKTGGRILDGRTWDEQPTGRLTSPGPNSSETRCG